MAEWYEILIPIASLITATVALLTVIFLKKQLRLTEKAYTASKTVAEIDAFQKIEANFSLNNSLTQVRTVISTKGPVLKNDGGTIDYKDFATYLDSVDRLVYYANIGIIPEETIVGVFGPAAIEIENNPYVMKYMKDLNEKYDKRMFTGITKLAEKTRVMRPELEKK